MSIIIEMKRLLSLWRDPKLFIQTLLTWRFIRFSISGGIATLVDVLLLYVLTDLVGFWYLFSALPSYVIGTFVHYTVSRRWVFVSNGSHIHQGSMFFAVQSLGMVINMTVLFVLVEYFGVWYIFAKLLTVVVAVTLNFNLNKYLTFRNS